MSKPLPERYPLSPLPDTTMREIYLSAIPFILCSLSLVALLIMFPPIAIWLPQAG